MRYHLDIIGSKNGQQKVLTTNIEAQTEQEALEKVEARLAAEQKKHGFDHQKAVVWRQQSLFFSLIRRNKIINVYNLHY